MGSAGAGSGGGWGRGLRTLTSGCASPRRHLSRPTFCSSSPNTAPLQTLKVVLLNVGKCKICHMPPPTSGLFGPICSPTPSAPPPPIARLRPCGPAPAGPAQPPLSCAGLRTPAGDLRAVRNDVALLEAGGAARPLAVAPCLPAQRRHQLPVAPVHPPRWGKTRYNG